MKSLKNKKGFTIVELVIVIAVIAILAAVMIPTFSNIITKANESSVQQTAVALYKEAYALDLSDGVLDGKYNENGTKTEIKKIEEKDVTYTVSEDEHTFTKFSYTDNGKKLTAEFNGTEWTVKSSTEATGPDENEEGGE